MAYVRKTIEELIAEEEKKSEQVKARMAELKGRQGPKSARGQSPQDRGGSRHHGSHQDDARFRKAVQEALNKAVTEPKHRAVIPDLLDEKAFIEAMQAAAKKAAKEAKEEAAADAAATEQQPAPAPRAAEQAKGGPEPLRNHRRPNDFCWHWRAHQRS